MFWSEWLAVENGFRLVIFERDTAGASSVRDIFEAENKRKVQRLARKGLACQHEFEIVKQLTSAKGKSNVQT